MTLPQITKIRRGPGRLNDRQYQLTRPGPGQLPGDRDPKPVRLWTSTIDAAATDMDRWWQAFLRRFDLEHTLPAVQADPRLDRPKIRTSAAGDRRTWLIIAGRTPLRLA